MLINATAVNLLITINHIQNKSVYLVYLLCIYKYTKYMFWKYLCTPIYIYSYNLYYLKNIINKHYIFLKYVHACVCIYIYT